MNKTNKKRNFLFCLKKHHKTLRVLPFLFAVIGIFLLPNTAYMSEINSENIIDLTNKERGKLNLEPLTANQLLTKAAYEKADALFNNQVFEHNINGKIFSSWIREAGYDYNYVGENLAIDFITAEGTIRAWMDSPSHKKNINNEAFKETGVAVVTGDFEGKESILVVQIFGTPMKNNIPATSAHTKTKETNNTKSEGLFNELSLNFFSNLNTIFYINTTFLIFTNIIFASILFQKNRQEVIL